MVTNYLNNRVFVLYFCPLCLGILTVFSFQPFNLTIINFFVLPSVFYLLIYIKKKSKVTYRKKPFKKNFFIFGTFFGFGFYFSGIHWIINSLTFDSQFVFLIPIALVLIPLFLSLFFSILFLLIGPFLNLNLYSLFFFSGGLAIFDYLRAKILTGFPWNLWVYSFSWSPEIIQILNKIGLFGLNLIFITIFLLPAVLFLNFSNTKKFLIFLFIPLLMSSFYIYGNFLINKNQIFLKSEQNNIEKQQPKVKVVSPNFNLEYNLTEKQIKERLKKLIRYSVPNKDNFTLFIWPEGVFSGYSYEEIKFLKNTMQNSFSDKHYILLGVNRLDKKKNGLYNSLIIINNKFEIIGEYKKQKLVPFGEFLPFEKFLNKIGLKKITEGHGSFLKGDRQKNLIIGELNILPLICYEVIFTKFIQQSNKETNIIINISEDGWFGDSIGPYQHFAKGIYRAIEQDTYFVRSANKGVSAIIDNKGLVVKKLNPGEVGNIELDIPLIKSKNKNKNDLIFFVLLITYIFIFYFYKKKYGTK